MAYCTIKEITTTIASRVTIKGDQDVLSVNVQISGPWWQTSFPYTDIFASGTITIGKTYSAKAEPVRIGTSSYSRATLRFKFDEGVLSRLKKGSQLSTSIGVGVYGTNRRTGSIEKLDSSGIRSPEFSIGDTFEITDENGNVNVVDLHPVINTEGLFTYAAVDDILPGKPADMLVQYHSKAAITFDTSRIETRFDATVAKIDVKYYTDTISTEDFTQPVVTGLIGGGIPGGYLPITIIATDSRGFSSEVDSRIPVYSYSSPVLTGMSAYRSDENKNEKDEGTYLTVQASESHTSLEGYNSCAITAEWGIRGQDGEVEPITSGDATVIGNGTILPTNSYVVTFTATDTIGKSNTVSLIVPTPGAVFDALKGGNGFAFGKMAERAGFLDSAWEISSDGGVYAGAEPQEDGSYTYKAYMDADGNIHADGRIESGFGLYSTSAHLANSVYAKTGEFDDAVYANMAEFHSHVIAGAGEFNHIDIESSLNVGGNATVTGVINANGGIAGVTNYPAAGVEELTGGRWIDGKPIYRQVLTYTVSTVDSTLNGPTIADFGELVSMTGRFYRTSAPLYHQLNFYRTSSDYNYAYMSTEGVLRVRSSDKAIVTAIVEYTKSTD